MRERYSDWRELGEGTFGKVYRAQDTLLNRPVAIKLLRSELQHVNNLVQGLLNEVNLSLDINDRAICRNYEVYQGGMGFGIVMEFIDGLTMRQWMDENRGKLAETLPQRLKLFAKLADALRILHEGPEGPRRGSMDIVHRDLKPANIMLRDRDPAFPVIMDLGLATMASYASDGERTGTPKYVAPEQWMPPHQVDGRADLFAMGIIGFELFTNLIPPSSLKNVEREKRPPRLEPWEMPKASVYCPGLPEGMDDLLNRLMASEPDQRPPTARALCQELDRILGRFVRWQELGSGAFGKVVAAWDQELKEWVAIKLLNPKHLNNPVAVSSLKQEVSISRRLQHPNICRIYELYEGVQGIGTIMERLQGVTLETWMQEHDHHLLETAPQRLEIFRGVVKALVYAHQYIVHRDIKPANIFLRDGAIDHPVIMDFGASVLGEMREDNVMVSGTPRYMSPEQWENPARVDFRSDLFCLGVMGYELFTGQLPPNSLRHVTRTRVVPRIPRDQILPLGHFCRAWPKALGTLIKSMMAHDQSERPQSTQEVYDALKSIRLESVNLDAVATAAAEGGDSVQLLRQELLESARPVAGGTFYLGARPGTGHTTEKPNRRVQISPFRMTPHPITNRQYRVFVEREGGTRPPWMNDPLFGSGQHPVVGVTHQDAQAFARWVGGELPSECQWERAAKGERQYPLYPWEEDVPPTSARCNIDRMRESTSAVDAYPMGISAFGIHDLCGNVWEWCRDGWNPDYYDSLPRSPAPLDPINEGREQGECSLRGGAFDSAATQGRCSSRGHAPADCRRNNIGFRVVFAGTGEEPPNLHPQGD